ncbi:MAG: ABC transporter ATP-binding protein [Candidatus Odinarchaeota archaeon]
MIPISINGLTKYYGKTLAVDNLSLEIREGEIFGFLGPNGAGKTTTIRTILGLLHPSSGSSTVLGEDSRSLAKSTRKKIGYLPGEMRLYGHMNGQEYLNLFLGFHDHSDDRQKELMEIFEGIKVNQKIRSLSTGQKQLIGLVAAFQHEPELFLLDEPTSGLDPLKQHGVYDLIKEERMKGRTFFFSSHILSEVQHLCDRVGIIRRGRLVEIETVGNLLNVRLKRVQVRLDSEKVKTLVSKLSNQEGFTDFQESESLLIFQFSGDYETLLKALIDISVQDLTIESPGLEEVFLKYYESDRNAVTN